MMGVAMTVPVYAVPQSLKFYVFLRRDVLLTMHICRQMRFCIAIDFRRHARPSNLSEIPRSAHSQRRVVAPEARARRHLLGRQLLGIDDLAFFHHHGDGAHIGNIV